MEESGILENTAVEQEDLLEDDDDEGDASFHIKVQNVVATVELDTTLDLEKIAHTARNAEYNPQRFQAVIIRIREPRTTALIFHSGKLIVTGAKDEDACKTAAKKFVGIIQKIGFAAHFGKFKIQNMTGTCDVGFPIRLEGFLYKHASQSTYEPELFPGLVYRMTDPKVVLLIFVSGKVVITGAKSTEDLLKAMEEIYKHLEEFRKRNVVVTAIRP
eukprot:gene9832-7037_t